MAIDSKSRDQLVKRFVGNIFLLPITIALAAVSLLVSGLSDSKATSLAPIAFSAVAMLIVILVVLRFDEGLWTARRTVLLVAMIVVVFVSCYSFKGLMTVPQLGDWRYLIVDVPAATGDVSIVALPDQPAMIENELYALTEDLLETVEKKREGDVNDPKATSVKEDKGSEAIWGIVFAVRLDVIYCDDRLVANLIKLAKGGVRLFFVGQRWSDHSEAGVKEPRIYEGLRKIKDVAPYCFVGHAAFAEKEHEIVRRFNLYLNKKEKNKLVANVVAQERLSTGEVSAIGGRRGDSEQIARASFGLGDDVYFLVPDGLEVRTVQEAIDSKNLSGGVVFVGLESEVYDTAVGRRSLATLLAAAYQNIIEGTIIRRLSHWWFFFLSIVAGVFIMRCAVRENSVVHQVLVLCLCWLAHFAAAALELWQLKWIEADAGVVGLLICLPLSRFLVRLTRPAEDFKLVDVEGLDLDVSAGEHTASVPRG